MTRIDLHVKILGNGVVERAKRRGLDGLVYAPHFTRLPDIERAAEAASDADLTIYPAREIFTGPWWDRRHVLALGLQEPVPDFLPFETTLAELERQDATVLVPHPTFFSVSLSESDIRTHREMIHAIEIGNPKHLPVHTRRARRLVAELGCPGFGSSYAHLPWTVGEFWTEFDIGVDHLDDLTAAIRNEEIRGIGRRNGIGHPARRAIEFAHLGWENSWEKFHRTVIAGQEPTHPMNPAYPARFQEEFVG